MLAFLGEKEKIYINSEHVMIMNVQRIRIIGGPGCGKTYISNALSEKFKIPTYDLDDIYWCNEKKSYNIKADPKIRDKTLLNILKKKEWIIEGVYGDWTRASFKDADVIIIIQSNKFIRSWRIIKRYIRRRVNLEKNNKKESWSSFLGLLKWSWNYYEKNFPGIYNELKKYEDKTVKITKSRIKIDEILNKVN